uniref:Receptor expression-enhancing protein n=1 Tax=Loa loa TaxID=7209 RepID=A0A1I7VUR2_LOALO
MATLVEADRRLSNVSLDERDLSGSERIFHGVTHKPQLFAFLCNKRYANLNNLLPPVELKASREQAIRTPNKEDDTQWLMYWTVFATFSIVDSMVSVITNSLPIYWLLKAAFLLYLYVPNSNGTQMLFYNIVNPIISVIDDFINSSYQSKRFNEFKNNHRYRLI